MQPTYRTITLLLTLLALAFSAQARIDQPSHVLYGNATLFGQPVAPGTIVEARLSATGETLISYHMGKDPRLEGQYALPVGMDDVSPRRTGYARPGNEVEIYIGSRLAAETTVGAIGRAVRLDIDPQYVEGGPTITIEDAEVLEGNSGDARVVTLPVTLSTTSTEAIDISWHTREGTATGGASCNSSVDFISAADTLTIPAGSMNADITVTICPDDIPEADETFTVELTATSSGTFARQVATVTLLDDDNNPEIRVTDTWVEKPRSGTAEAVFSVTLSRDHHRNVSFDWQTEDRTAVAGQDYLASQGTLEIEAGDIAGQIRITVLPSAATGPQKAFALRLDNAQMGTLLRSTATAIIADPDHDPSLRHEQDAVNGEDGIRGIADPSALAITRAGHHLYVTSESTGQLTILDRQRASGRLSVFDSIDTETPGFESMVMDGPVDIAISNDDAHVYIVAHGSDSLVAFTRSAADGSLALQDSYVHGSRSITGMQEPRRLTLSPDGEHLYVSGSNSIAVFSRDSATGALTFLESESNNTDDPEDSGGTVVALQRPAGLTVSPDGRQLLVATRMGNALLIFDRSTDPSSPDFGQLSFRQALQDNLAGIEGLTGATDVAVSADGGQVYVTAEQASTLIRFDRDANGNLDQAKIWTSGEAQLPGMGGPQRLELAPDNVELFVSGFADHSFTVFDRTAAQQDASRAGHLDVAQTIFDGQATTDHLAGPTDIAASHDKRHVYVLANQDNAIVVFTRLSADALFSDRFAGE